LRERERRGEGNNKKRPVRECMKKGKHENTKMLFEWFYASETEREKESKRL